MKLLYKFLSQNSRAIIIFSLIVFIHIYFVLNLKNKAYVVSEKVQLHKDHQVAQAIVSNDLIKECSIFNSKAKLSEITNKYIDSNLEFNIERKRIIKLDKLVFYEIFFQTTKKLNANIFVKSKGYLVEHEQNKNCFGVL